MWSVCLQAFHSAEKGKCSAWDGDSEFIGSDNAENVVHSLYDNIVDGRKIVVEFK